MTQTSCFVLIMGRKVVSCVFEFIGSSRISVIDKMSTTWKVEQNSNKYLDSDIL